MTKSSKIRIEVTSVHCPACVFLRFLLVALLYSHSEDILTTSTGSRINTRSTNTTMVPQNNNIKGFLPENYVPSEFDVMCGRGFECFRHSGNAIFRKTVDNSVMRYATALSKQKAIIVQDVIKQVRSKSSEPAKFIRLCHKLNCWYEITDDSVRQKVAQTLREALIQRDPEKRKLYNKKRAKKRAIRIAAKSPGPPELAVLAHAHAKQLQLTASQETPSLFRMAVFPSFQYVPVPISFLVMQTPPTRLKQASLVDLVDETLGCIRQEASLVDPFDEETLGCIHPASPGSMSSEDWFTVGDVVGNDCGDTDLLSVFW